MSATLAVFREDAMMAELVRGCMCTKPKRLALEYECLAARIFD